MRCCPHVGEGASSVLVGALDLGGSHVTTSLVDTNNGRVLSGTTRRAPLDPHGSADELLEAIGAVMAEADASEVGCWGLAVPGPFDYAQGVARYEGVGKFDALYGVDLRTRLGARVAAGPAGLAFVNDADAFALGEWSAGAVAGVERLVAVTLGSGVGSAFLRDGAVVDSGDDVPPEGSAHLLSWQGRPLEDTVSRRALRLAYGGSAVAGPDVAEITARARAGEPRAVGVVDAAFRALGAALGPWVRRFGATHLVLGGSVSRSSDVVVPPLAAGLQGAGAGVDVVLAAGLEASALLGAALWAHRAAATSPPGSR